MGENMYQVTLDNVCVRENCESRISELPPAPSGTTFPDKLIWEETTSGGVGLYRGKAALIFPTNWTGVVQDVSLPSEVAQFAEVYKGHQVFRFIKAGYEYLKPLVFAIKSTKGNFIHTIGSSVTPPPITDPSGTFKGKYTTSTSDGYRTLRLMVLGSSLGHSLKFVFENGYSVVIPDTNKRFEVGNRLLIYRCGGSGLTTSDEKYTSHGGMGIWASTKLASSSQYVSIYRLS